MKIKRIISFIRENYSCAVGWNDEHTAKWISYFDKRNMISIVLKGKKIVGFALARPLKKLLDSNDSYEYDEDGDIAFVDLVVCKNKETRFELYRELLRKVGRRRWIAFARKLKGRGIMIYDLHKFMRRFCLQGGI